MKRDSTRLEKGTPTMFGLETLYLGQKRPKQGTPELSVIHRLQSDHYIGIKIFYELKTSGSPSVGDVVGIIEQENVAWGVFCPCAAPRPLGI